MGIHTGDSITVAPALTLTDKEYQIMRNASIACCARSGSIPAGRTSSSPSTRTTGRLVVIEMNPRVSRPRRWRRRPPAFPIAKVAAKLAVGYTLDELDNDITKVTPAQLRADHRLCRHQNPALHLREIPRRRSPAVNVDEIGRRSDVDRSHLPGKLAESVAVDGNRSDGHERSRYRRRP